MPKGNKPLPKPVLTKFYDNITYGITRGQWVNKHVSENQTSLSSSIVFCVALSAHALCLNVSIFVSYEVHVWLEINTKDLWMSLMFVFYSISVISTLFIIHVHRKQDKQVNKTLTLNVQEPSYLGLTRSISWPLMPWLLTSPGHQQPWYWLCRICRSCSYSRKDFKYLCHINVE